METYLYLSLIPEALVFSQLPPDRFGKYLAIGDKKLTRGPAMFFEVDPDLDLPDLRIQELRATCETHPDGSPRRSRYVSVYGALAQLPISALRDLYLTTSAGITLKLEEAPYQPDGRKGFHLYQELCPVFPKVASPLQPEEFCRFVTDPANPVSLPKLVFAELKLNGLATDPEKSSASNLPYKDMNHLRECLTSLQYKSDKMTKIVHRDFQKDLIYPVIDSGIFVGDQETFRAYPFPSPDELETTHHVWWSSATSVSRF